MESFKSSRKGHSSKISEQAMLGALIIKQGWIHGYPSRVRVGRGHIRGHQIIWAGAVRSKNKKHKKS